MGMFDTIKSSYDLGPGFSKELQTKDLDCCMNHYWISPVGQLFLIDHAGTQDFVGLDTSTSNTFPVFRYKSNGNHGRVSPISLFKVIEVYPAKWDAYYSAFPSCQILFRDGIITEVRHVALPR